MREGVRPARAISALSEIAVAHFDPRLAGSHLAAIGRADDCFCRLQFLVNCHKHSTNKVQFDPRSLKKLICS